MKKITMIAALLLTVQTFAQTSQSIGLKYKGKTILQTTVNNESMSDQLDDISITFENKEYTFRQISQMEMSESQITKMVTNVNLMRAENEKNPYTQEYSKIYWGMYHLEKGLMKRNIYLDDFLRNNR